MNQKLTTSTPLIHWRRQWLLPACLLIASWLWLSQNFAWAAPSPVPQNGTVPLPISDDFNECVLDGSTWSFVDPLGDATLFMNGEQAEIHVPAAVNHDIWVDGNRAPRLMQAADNTDFELETKFTSLFTDRHQIQGILVEQDDENFLRVNFQFDGTTTRIFAASFVTATQAALLPTTHVNEIIANADRAPLYMRLLRQGDTWRISYSYDGAAWTSTPALTFTHATTVRRVGLFAGNAGNNPAFTGLVDYFFNRLTPINPEDPIIRSLPIYTVGKGEVLKSCGNPIMLTAQPSPGWDFVGWSGSLSGTTTPASLTLSGTEVVTATFEPKGIELTVNVSGKGTVTWDPNRQYFDLNEIVQFTATADPDWEFVGWMGDLSGSELSKTLVMDGSKSVTAHFASLTESGIQSDDFNSCALDSSLWSFINPLDDAVLTMSGQTAQIAVPAGVSHNVWTDGINAPRLMQLTRNVDFELEVKFESPLTRRFQMQGLLVQQDDENLLRFNFQSTSLSTIEVTAISFKKGNPTVQSEEVITIDVPMYLRVGRVGDSWTMQYSADGTQWQSLPSFTFPLVVTQVGVFAGNAGGNPDHTALIDYLFLTTAPISQEDSSVMQLLSTATGSGSVSLDPAKESYDCGETVAVEAVPAAGWEFAGWSGDIAGTDNPYSLVIDGTKNVEATFVQSTYALATSVQGQGEIAIGGSTSNYVYGTEVTLDAQPASGWRFVRWDGDVSGTTTQITYVIEADSEIIAVFEEIPIDGQGDSKLYLPFVSR